MHMGADPGQDLGCLHSLHSRSRCVTIPFLAPDFSRSVLVALWKQCLWDMRADYWHAHGWGGAECSANNCVLREPAQRVKGDTTEHTHQWTALAEEYSVAPLPVRALQSHIPCTAVQKRSSEMDLGLLFLKLRSRPCTWQGSDNHRAKRRTCSTSSEGSGHHNTSHTSYQGDNSQHSPRKEAAGIRTQNSTSTKNVKPIQSTQGTLPHKNSPPRPQWILFLLNS